MAGAHVPHQTPDLYVSVHIHTQSELEAHLYTRGIMVLHVHLLSSLRKPIYARHHTYHTIHAVRMILRDSTAVSCLDNRFTRHNVSTMRKQGTQTAPTSMRRCCAHQGRSYPQAMFPTLGKTKGPPRFTTLSEHIMQVTRAKLWIIIRIQTLREGWTRRNSTCTERA